MKCWWNREVCELEPGQRAPGMSRDRKGQESESFRQPTGLCPPCRWHVPAGAWGLHEEQASTSAVGDRICVSWTGHKDSVSQSPRDGAAGKLPQGSLPRAAGAGPREPRACGPAWAWLCCPSMPRPPPHSTLPLFPFPSSWPSRSPRLPTGCVFPTAQHLILHFTRTKGEKGFSSEKKSQLHHLQSFPYEQNRNSSQRGTFIFPDRNWDVPLLYTLGN